MFSVINYKVIEMEERRQAILRKLEEKGSVRVAELSKELGCSEVTIRNDIKNMDQEGLLKRTHGGALQIDSKTVRKYSAESIYRNVERKKQIAACAYAFIEDRDTIIIDDASSSFYLAAYIKEHPDVDRNHDGKIQYVILEGEMGHQDAIIRTESVVESLKEQGIELEKLSYQIANWNRAQAQNRMMQLIGQYNNRMEVVLANNDAMALGAMDAYEKLGYTETNRPVFFGIDGTKEGLEAVKDGTLAATVYNDKEGQAAAMANLAFSIATEDENNPNPFKNYKYIYRAYQKVTKENVQTFLEKEE